MGKQELGIRLKERLRIYRDSPGLQVTYVDLAHVVEDLLEVISYDETIGFQKKGQS